jgi:hypothetical protein
VVEHPTFNRMVLGSNPSRPTIPPVFFNENNCLERDLQYSFAVGVQDLFPIRAMAVATRRFWVSTFNRSRRVLSSGRVAW